MKILSFAILLFISTSYCLAQNNSCEKLLLAVKDNDTSLVKSLLKNQDPNCSYRGKTEPRSPLGVAAKNGNLEIGYLDPWK